MSASSFKLTISRSNIGHMQYSVERLLMCLVKVRTHHRETVPLFKCRSCIVSPVAMQPARYLIAANARGQSFPTLKVILTLFTTNSASRSFSFPTKRLFRTHFISAFSFHPIMLSRDPIRPNIMSSISRYLCSPQSQLQTRRPITPMRRSPTRWSPRKDFND